MNNPHNDNAKRICPEPVTGSETVVELCEKSFFAYNAARTRDAIELLIREISDPAVTTVWTMSGALTPAGLGISCIVPLLRAGWIDWLVSTGANLYHDLHYALDLPLHRGIPNLDDRDLKERGLVRIYDILMNYDVLLNTDCFVRDSCDMFDGETNSPLSTPEFHALLGDAITKKRHKHVVHPGILETAFEMNVPVFCPAPADSSIGMNLAALSLMNGKTYLDVAKDVNLSAAIVWNAKSTGGKSAVIILGGGTPKNFALQTEPHLQEVLGLRESGHDFMIQITDARPDTGGLSGATPSEAVSWGKINPEELKRTVVVYMDVTVALPLLTSCLLSSHPTRTPKRLMLRMDDLLNELKHASNDSR